MYNDNKADDNITFEVLPEPASQFFAQASISFRMNFVTMQRQHFQC